MTTSKQLNTQRTIVAKLEPGADILEELERLVHQYDVSGGQISFIGAISQATLGYFDLHSQEYKSFSMDEDLEVTSGMGNISRLENGTPVVHAHIVVANEQGHSFSGHLMKGCKVSVTIEIVMNLFDDSLIRGKDERTGLNLLKLL